MQTLSINRMPDVHHGVVAWDFRTGAISASEGEGSQHRARAEAVDGLRRAIAEKTCYRGPKG